MSFILEAVKGVEDIEKLDSGTHATLRQPNGIDRIYSIVSGSQNQLSWKMALEQNSRGVLPYLHETTSIENAIKVSAFGQPVLIAKASKDHFFVKRHGHHSIPLAIPLLLQSTLQVCSRFWNVLANLKQ